MLLGDVSNFQLHLYNFTTYTFKKKKPGRSRSWIGFPSSLPQQLLIHLFTSCVFIVPLTDHRSNTLEWAHSLFVAKSPCKVFAQVYKNHVKLINKIICIITLITWYAARHNEQLICRTCSITPWVEGVMPCCYQSLCFRVVLPYTLQTLKACSVSLTDSH